MGVASDGRGIAATATGAVDLEDLVGNTPLLRLARIDAAVPGVEIYGKAEWANPGGSVKDRAALAMIREGERSGALTADKTILDSTSGNTGIAYAMFGAKRGYRVKLCLPANANVERKQILAAYGAELVLTDPAEGSDGAIRIARQLNADEPGRYFYPDQYNNPCNWLAHYEGTGLEIWHQTGGRITHFLAALGTTGTFVGAGRRLKELNPAVRLVSLEPDSPFHGLEGMKHLETAIVPGIFDATLADERMEISTEAAYAMARRLARDEGVFVGISAAAAVAASLDLARRIESGVIVTVLCDGGLRYLSEHFWTEREGGDE
jgi:S-sulfo-L-cysteine synthase (O-acetyl-L-serine-dependent)